MANDKTLLTLASGEEVSALAPYIISASRATDIPAFYVKWFFDRLDEGYCTWVNPFNQAKHYVSFEKTRFVVFWSKNPKPLMKYYDSLQERGIGSYIQYTLNDYETEGLERVVPPLKHRIETFRQLSERWGRDGVIWRFDPMILSDVVDEGILLERLKVIGDALHGYTNKLVFSYADIGVYRKVQNNLRLASVAYQEWTAERMRDFAERLSVLNAERWGYELATCCEELELGDVGVQHNRCIDDRLIVRRAYEDEELLNFLGYKVSLFPVSEDCLPLPNGTYLIPPGASKKDKGQRKVCGCVVSKDIGYYNTCPHECIYCYANTSIDVARRRYMEHKNNPEQEGIV